MTAAYYGFSLLRNNTKLTAFARTPFYEGYPERCSVVFGSCFWNATVAASSDDIVEFVTVPNNPDGFFRTPLYATDMWLHDLVYYWPHLGGSGNSLTALKAPVTLFSMTKFTGHASARFGWAFVHDKRVADAMVDFVDKTILDGSVSSMWRTLVIVEYLLESRNADDFFDWTRALLDRRWTELDGILAQSKSFVNHAKRGTEYAWLDCIGNTTEQAMAAFAQFGVLPNRGTLYGQDGFVRLNLLLMEDTWITLKKVLVLLG
jgi:aspartate/methionine/tyrosine aminotransferase